MFKRLIDRLTVHTDADADAGAGDGARAERELLDSYVAQARAVDDFWIGKFQHLPTARAIAATAPEARLRFVGLALDRLRDLRRVLARKRKRYLSFNDADHQAAFAMKQLVSNLLRARLPFDEQSLATLLNEMAMESRWAPLSVEGVLRAAEYYAEERALSDEHRKQLQKLKTYLGETSADQRRAGQRIAALLAATGGGAVARGVTLAAGDPWSDAMTDALARADAPTQDVWQRLLNHAVTARGAKPSAKWLRIARMLIDGIGRERFVAGLSEWLPLVGKPGVGNQMRGHLQPHLEPTVLNEHNADVLRGIVWSAAAVDDPILARLLGDVAEVCFKKIPMHGARCPKVANACLAALALMKGPEPVAQLSRIQAKAKKPSAQKLIEKALARSAEQQGVSPEELEEMSVPDFGLDLTGQRIVPVGEWTAEIELTPRRDVELRWRKAGAAKAQAAAPADVKRDHADALKDVKRLVKDIERVLPTQVARIERLLLDERSWPLDLWRDRYLEHPLIAPFARRLIWQLDGDPPRTFIRSGERFVDAAGQQVDVPTTAQLRLWHPIRSTPDEVLAWRQYLESHGVTQPFKQAHREIYLLTDAERHTRTYSNRFAGHVLRQHQFHALCGARGWSYHLQGAFNSHNVPTRVLRRQHMRVEFWVDGGIGDAAQTSDAGIFLHVSTDQVRFYGGETEQEPMVECVPPHVFSELMRDVDLFVGVCSVGNDPTWRDRGEQFGQYWQSYTFGELAESAKTRRDVLSRLLPRLKIADRATLEDRFLVVRGDLRTYKIHLGSSNIQMEPNNQYLCIVPDRSPRAANEDVFLPFEGDQTLAVILSKAFMLADDRHIKDPSIVSQIRVRR